jgi:dihydrodipicolinate synthase/N-acetylneuraminate lyase
VLQPALAAGATGAILALANALPEAFVAIHRLHQQGNPAGALELNRHILPTVRGTLGATEVPGVKAAMDARGLFGGPPRPPLTPVAGTERDAIRGELEQLVADGVLATLAL